MNRIISGIMTTSLIICLCIFAITPMTITTAAKKPAATTAAKKPAATTAAKPAATTATKKPAATTAAKPAATTAAKKPAATTAAKPAATTAAKKPAATTTAKKPAATTAAKPAATTAAKPAATTAAKPAATTAAKPAATTAAKPAATTAAKPAATTSAKPAATTAAKPAATTAAKPEATTAAKPETDPTASMTPQEKIDSAKKHLETISEDDTTIRIMLDPGHGGEDSGASGYGKSEKKVVLAIGKALAHELQKYDNVIVGLTRDKDKEVDLHKRTKLARQKKADIMISLHCDAYDSSCLYDNGSSVLVARKGTYKTEMVTEENRLARSILAELEGLGLTNQGLVRRASAEGDRYEDGSIADYYGIIRDGMLYDFPVILIEHCFMDSKKDHKLVLSSKEKIRKLAAADARGIAKYLGLRKKDTGKIEQANVRRGKELTCSGKEDSFFSLQKKVYYINAKRDLETMIADAKKELESMETSEAASTAANGENLKGDVDDGKDNSGKNQISKQESISRIQSTPQQDQTTESLAITFGLALLAYYGLAALLDKNARMHG